MALQYIWESGKPRRVMHISEGFTIRGEVKARALCGAPHSFNRSINAPFGLGRRVCRRCLKRLKEIDQ